jgi:hypothetical protein
VQQNLLSGMKTKAFNACKTQICDSPNLGVNRLKDFVEFYTKSIPPELSISITEVEITPPPIMWKVFKQGQAQAKGDVMHKKR